jgi:hypothetical protein
MRYILSKNKRTHKATALRLPSWPWLVNYPENYLARGPAPQYCGRNTTLLPLAPPAASLPPYAPSLHVLATFRTPTAWGRWPVFVALVAQQASCAWGKVYHTFAGSDGFTAVLAFIESHLSIHR